MEGVEEGSRFLPASIPSLRRQTLMTTSPPQSPRPFRASPSPKISPRAPLCTPLSPFHCRQTHQMCRLVAFSGQCSHCSSHFTWDELSQRLSCLEAKNAGVFGHCRRGVQVEEHAFDQECDKCTAELEADEGYGGMEEDTRFGEGVGKGNVMADKSEDGSSGRRKRQRIS